MSELFDIHRIYNIAQYLSPYHNQPAYAKIISGRAIEEIIELHIESGGDALSAMGHVMDAITNESFKAKARLGGSGGPKQEAYPSKMAHIFNEDEVLSELADNFMMFVLNLLNLRQNKLTEEEINSLQSRIATRVDEKLRKLEVAREEDRLIMTENGTYYINKGV